jgi:hypothetical protein
MYTIEAEYTDTFGGEVNYCWVKRASLEIADYPSETAIRRRILKALGLSGVRGRWESYGDAWQFRPYRMCTIVLANVAY